MSGNSNKCNSFLKSAPKSNYWHHTSKVTLPMFICSAKDRLLLIFSFALSPVHLFFGQMILSHGDVDQIKNLHPSKKVTQHKFGWFLFLLSWICIHQVRYPWKACLFAFRLMPYLLGLFHWCACRVSKLRAMSKRKSYFGAMNGQWVRMHIFTKGKPQTWHSMHFPYNPINFATFPFWHCPQFTHPARAPDWCRIC